MIRVEHLPIILLLRLSYGVNQRALLLKALSVKTFVDSLVGDKTHISCLKRIFLVRNMFVFI